jgi:hypothetical protein
MLLPPLEVILGWPHPNYVDPVKRGNSLTVLNTVFVAVALVVVGLRIYTRIFVVRFFGVDDVFIIIAAVSIHIDVGGFEY